MIDFASVWSNGQPTNQSSVLETVDQSETGIQDAPHLCEFCAVKTVLWLFREQYNSNLTWCNLILTDTALFF